nr:hypothetical protein [Tanacetum cinerariifolium]
MYISATHNAITEDVSKDRAPMLVAGSYVIVPQVPPTDSNQCCPEETKLETYSNVDENTKKRIDAKAEAVYIILTGIDNDIYSTTNGYANAKQMWIVVEHLMQGENINEQDVKTNLYWAHHGM